MMQRLSNLSLGIKLIGVLIVVLTTLLASTILLLTTNTNNLTKELGSERIGQEISIIESRLETSKSDLNVDADFLASGVLLFQAVGRRNNQDVTEIMNSANQSLKLDDMDVVDGDGNRLFDLSGDSNAYEDALLRLALEGQSRSDILIEIVNNVTQINLVASSPIVSTRGNILGALQISRRMDDGLLDEFAFSQTNIELALVYNEEIQAQSRLNGLISASYLQNEGKILQATLLEEKQPFAISGVLSASTNLPYVTAHISLSPLDSIEPVTLIVLVELGEIAAFQNVTLINTILVFIVLTLVSVVVLYAATNFIAIRPVNNLTQLARQMTEGRYDQRIPMAAKDEIGRLAENFNMMATAIQQREISLDAAREQAETADKVKSAFLASMSHELRTPLNAIINFSKFLRRGIIGTMNDEQNKLINNIVDSGQHLLNLINDVLDMSKIESDSLRLYIEPNLNISEIVNTAIKYTQPLLSESPVVLQAEIQENMPEMTGDRKRLVQILLNILSNACKFTEQGHIKIKVAVSDQILNISVEDTGPGISPSDYNNVFSAFKQTESGLRHGGGTGLGMPICKRLVEIHGGKIWFESQLNTGTTFFVQLPLHTIQD